MLGRLGGVCGFEAWEGVGRGVCGLRIVVVLRVERLRWTVRRGKGREKGGVGRRLGSRRFLCRLGCSVLVYWRGRGRVVEGEGKGKGRRCIRTVFCEAYAHACGGAVVCAGYCVQAEGVLEVYPAQDRFRVYIAVTKCVSVSTLQ